MAATGTGESRLIYGMVDGVRRSARATAFAIGAARAVDGTLGWTGVTRPAVLVSGFWRSGTTWVQEVLADALGAKTVFEPLSPQEPAWRRTLSRRLATADEDRLQAFIPGPAPADDGDFWAHLHRCCTGRHTDPFLLSCRRSIGESFRRAAVVKDVRLQWNLAAIHARTGAPVFHVRRHPCAVVASLIAADWHWSFARVRLADLVPAWGASAPDPARLVDFDRDAMGRIAAYWALTEHAAQASLQGRPWAAILQYEDLLDDAAGLVADACRQAGLRPVKAVAADRPSASVDPDVFARYRSAPRERWRTLLRPAEAERIIAIVDALHPAWRAPG